MRVAEEDRLRISVEDLRQKLEAVTLQVDSSDSEKQKAFELLEQEIK